MIELVPYDPVWRSRFEEEARALRTAFGALARRIEHVGSLCEDGGFRERKHIAFRDRLRTDAQARERYAAVKRKLAALHGGSTHEERQHYSDGKTEFVRSMLAIPAFLEEFSRWAAGRPEVVAAALVGSHARGTATTGSDVDLVILCEAPQDLLAADWPKTFGDVESRGIEDYGALRSLRVHYRGGPEVEFGVALPSWAALPLDPGTRAVLADGACILHDPSRILQAARRAALRQSAQRMG